jgi:hypothetical protein
MRTSTLGEVQGHRVLCQITWFSDRFGGKK